MMRDPAEVEKEEMLKKEAKKNAAEQKTALFEVLWRDFLQYFNFKDISTLSGIFFEACANEGVYVPKEHERPSSMIEAPGHTHHDASISRGGAIFVANEWIQFRYGERRSASKIPASLDANAKWFADNPAFTMGQEKWNFPACVALCKANQELFLERDSMAGFNATDVEGFKGLFDLHRGSSPELKPQQIWGLLSDCRLEMPSAEDQQNVIKILHEVDKNKNGMLSVEELLHLVRRLLDSNKVPDKIREHALLEKSNMGITDIEDWFQIYKEVGGSINTADSDCGISDIKDVFERVGFRWDKEGTKQMKEWLNEVDEDYNGSIDFAEFCCLIQKMWDANFFNIRSLDLAKLVRDE